MLSGLFLSPILSLSLALALSLSFSLSLSPAPLPPGGALCRHLGHAYAVHFWCAQKARQQSTEPAAPSVDGW